MRAWLVVAVVVGCGKTSTPVSPAPDASIVLVSPVDAEAPRPRVFAVPAGADPELATIAASICAAGYRVEDGKKVLGCRKPPPFDRKDRGPDGTFPEHTGDATTFCPFEILARGAFTRADPEQIALRFDACHEESETWDVGMPGSVVVVEARGGGYEVVAVALDVNANRCRKTKIGALDYFVCQSAFAAGGFGAVTYFFTLLFVKAPWARTFVRLYDDAEVFTCVTRAGDPKLAPDGLVAVAVAGMHERGIEDGEMLVTIDVDRARATPSAALESRLLSLCGKEGSAAAALPPKQRFHLEFTGFGPPLHARPETQKLLDAWEKETPGLTQLRGATPP
ncbi:MAG TPA: hypothetical protein VIF62_35555 [Labilithrix sp.]